jgi:hypothetical protein
MIDLWKIPLTKFKIFHIKWVNKIEVDINSKLKDK